MEIVFTLPNSDEKGSVPPNKDQQHTTKVKSNSDDECDMGDTSFTEEVRIIFLRSSKKEC